MNDFLKNVINFLANPIIYFTAINIGWIAMMKYYRIWTEPKFIKIVMWVAIIGLGWALFDENFRHEALKPDNVPIWIMSGSVGFWHYLIVCPAAED